MNSMFVYIMIGIIIGGAGALILVGLWMSSRSNTRTKAQQPEASPASAPPPPAGTDDALRVWRSQDDGALVVEFRGQRYRRLMDVSDGETGRELLKVLGDLTAFSQGKMAPRPASLRAPVTAPLFSVPASPVEEEFLSSLQLAPSKPAAKKKKKDAPPEPPEILGIAGQIEKSLQRRLEGQPDMLARNIHVGSAPDGSLRVEADGVFYPGIDQVPDPAVREILQSAVKDWEARI